MMSDPPGLTPHALRLPVCVTPLTPTVVFYSLTSSTLIFIVDRLNLFEKFTAQKNLASAIYVMVVGG